MGTKINNQEIVGLRLPVNTLAELATIDASAPENVNTVRICSDSTPANIVWSNGTDWIAVDDGTIAA